MNILYVRHQYQWNNNNNNNNDTYIAQIRRCSKCASASNRNVFSLFLKVFSEVSVDRKSYGRLFHTVGPWNATVT